MLSKYRVVNSRDQNRLDLNSKQYSSVGGLQHEEKKN